MFKIKSYKLNRGEICFGLHFAREKYINYPLYKKNTTERYLCIYLFKIVIMIGFF